MTRKPQSGLDFTRPAVRKTDPDTSHDAYRQVMPKLPERYSKIMLVAATFGSRGFTASQLADRMGLPRDSVSPRLPELEDKRLMVRTPARRQVEGHSSQTVWVHPEYFHAGEYR